MEPKIIYQDESLFVIDKPAGWVVNDAQTTKNQNTIQSWLEKLDFPLSKNKEFRSGVVHRLDKETSGVLVVAKTTEAFLNLQKQFKDRKVKKTYIALVHGKMDLPTGGEGEIKAPVGRLPWRRDRFGVLPQGRDATTRYSVIGCYGTKGDNYSLLKLWPETGRTHQIRIHLKYLGHPIVSDEFYAGRKTARKDRKWCPRLFLHALKITLYHPKTGEDITFESVITTDLKEALSKLK